MDYLWPCLLFVWASFCWTSYLAWRQRKVYKESGTVPPELEGVIKQDVFDKSRYYQLDKSTYSLAHSLYKQVEFLLFIVLGVLPFVWNISGYILSYTGYNNEVLQSVVFVQLFLLYSEVTAIPWSVYHVFVLEEKHGFNKQTADFFIKDHIKSFVLQYILVSLLTGGLIFVIKWGGEYFYVYAWLFVFAVSMIFVMTYHDFIAPLFDKYTPLPDGELRTAIETLAVSLKFPLTKLQVVEGSVRSAHSNAYFYGFGSNKVIVLFDTLLQDDMKPKTEEKEKTKNKNKTENKEDENETENKEDENETENKEDGNETENKEDGIQKEKVEEEVSMSEEKDEAKKTKGCSIDEILAVLAHELGHWKYSHNIKNITIAEINFFLSFFMFGYFMNQQDMFDSFGFNDSRPIIIGLIIVFELIFTPYNFVFSFIMTQICRMYEYHADEFAQSLKRGPALGSALTKLVTDNLSFPIADPLYSAFNHTHPTLLERIRKLKEKQD